MASTQAAISVTTFSFIVPVRNEADDVEAAIRSAELAARPEAPCEIIVVDDASTDGTRDVLRRYARQGRIKLVEHPRACGAATARNSGLAAAGGDVAVFMDADNVVPPDFLERLRNHYLGGGDYVTVESYVVNQGRLVGRFQQACHQLTYGGLRNVGYSQSFSCRRELALEVGFRSGLVGSEDGEFFGRLRTRSGNWVKDPAIEVGHRMPDSAKALWAQHRWRGQSSVRRRWDVKHPPLLLLTARKLAMLALWASLVLTVLPTLVQGVRLARHSSSQVADAPAFVVLWVLRGVARRVGEWTALVYLWRHRRTKP